MPQIVKVFAKQTPIGGGGVYATADLETYRSGHNGAHSKCVWRATATWVRIPPSPLIKSQEKSVKHPMTGVLRFFILPHHQDRGKASHYTLHLLPLQPSSLSRPLSRYK